MGVFYLTYFVFIMLSEIGGIVDPANGTLHPIGWFFYIFFLNNCSCLSIFVLVICKHVVLTTCALEKNVTYCFVMRFVPCIIFQINRRDKNDTNYFGFCDIFYGGFFSSRIDLLFS